MDDQTRALVTRKYRIINQLEDVWFGSVYEARRAANGRRVILKVMHRRLAAETRLANQIYNGLKKASHIAHPNLARLISIDKTPKNVVFFSREYLTGAPLKNTLASGGKLPVVLALDVLSQTLAALRAIHKRGLIHGHLNPESIFLTGSENKKNIVKLINYGMLDIQELVRCTDIAKNYMSPEQALGEGGIDIRTDIFAAGTILYELLSGKQAYEADENEDVSLKIALKPPPPLTQAVEDLSPQVVSLVEKAMASDAKGRYVDATALMEDIDACCKTLSKDGPISVGAAKTLSATIHGVPRPRVLKKPSKMPPLPKPGIRDAAPPARLHHMSELFEDSGKQTKPDQAPDPAAPRSEKWPEGSDIGTHEIMLPIEQAPLPRGNVPETVPEGDLEAVAKNLVPSMEELMAEDVDQPPGLLVSRASKIIAIWKALCAVVLGAKHKLFETGKELGPRISSAVPKNALPSAKAALASGIVSVSRLLNTKQRRIIAGVGAMLLVCLLMVILLWPGSRQPATEPLTHVTQAGLLKNAPPPATATRPPPSPGSPPSSDTQHQPDPAAAGVDQGNAANVTPQTTSKTDDTDEYQAKAALKSAKTGKKAAARRKWRKPKWSKKKFKKKSKKTGKHKKDTNAIGNWATNPFANQ
ncbi:MAG: serine/threonine-protein kinase [Myxococcota bacterium]|nr:serine/threonine-protein kinase [Myxococcota bacterium]